MAQENIIETCGLTRRFGALTAVSNLNLEVPAGSIYGFLGPNGAGKTTTIRMLLGLIRPDAGLVRLFGRPLASDRYPILCRVGAFVETPSIYPHLTGRENLEITRCLLRVPVGRLDQALAIVGLESAADRRARDYSQGMRQRLGLALALLGEVDLLILDEPTNGLDPAGIRETRDLVRRLAAEFGMTVFLSSHLLGEVEQVATHVGIVHQGHMLFQGRLSDLKTRLHRHVHVGVDNRERAELVLGKAGWRLTPSDNGYLKVAAASAAEASRLNAELTSSGVQVFHLALEQPSLEDLFFQITEGH